VDEKPTPDERITAGRDAAIRLTRGQFEMSELARSRSLRSSHTSMLTRSLALVLLLVSALDAGAAARLRVVTAPFGVPVVYSDLYAQLAVDLTAAVGQLAPLHPDLGTRPVYAAELLPANGNRGTDLLQTSTMGGVRAYLDALQRLGVRGVVFPIGYPLLLDRFPGSAQYLDFYRQVMAEVRARGMTVDIESSVAFANSPFSSITWDYSQTTFAQFVQDRHDMAAKIVAELKPDYLDLGAEPDTEAKLTGFAQLNVPANWAQTISAITQGISRDSTKIGTGVGTWNNVSFVDAESALPIDFIALHIYPVDAGSIATALQAVTIARAHGKAVVIDEAWLFKARAGESTSIASDTTVFARDAYSFFAPLDQQFLRFLDDFARVDGVSFISPFWSSYFFSYIPYTTATASLPYSAIVQQANSAAAQNIVRGQSSATGAYYASLIAGH
jgi:hypothetical protein